MKEIKFRLFPLLGVFILWIACNDKTKKEEAKDQFYSEKGDWDSGRIPLVKPYEAIIDNKKLGWGIGLDGADGDTGFANIKNINVVDSVILIYSENSLLHGIYVPQSWHIIVPSKRIEKGFGKHGDYMNYLNKLGFGKEPKLHSIESIAKYFDKHDVIDWQQIQ